MKKYIFTGETMEFEGHTLRRIQYNYDFGQIEKGDLGGWIEHEGNFSHDGDCAILDDAKVFGHARIEEYAVVADEAVVKDNTLIKGTSFVFQKAIIGADTICENTLVGGESKIFFYSSVGGFSKDSPVNVNLKSSTISGKTKIEGTGIVLLSKIFSSEIGGLIDCRNVEVELNKRKN